MFKNLQKITFLSSPLIIAGAICLFIAGILFLLPEKSTTPQVQGISQQLSPTPTATPTTVQAVPTTAIFYNPTSTPVPTQAVAAQNNSSSATPTHSASLGQASAPTQTVETFQVHLSINGAAVGDVTVQKEQNQCDVLSRAKEQGKISSLLMKYDNSLGTYGVYQINGIGKENAIWWVYKVNGQSPSQGCSYIKANAGDNVEWEYKG